MPIIDDYTKKLFIYLFKDKSQEYDKFSSWVTLVKNQTSRKVKSLTTNNGLEFCNHGFNQFFGTNGILRHNIITYTSQQNGVVERMNRTLLNEVRCPLATLDLPKNFLGKL